MSKADKQMAKIEHTKFKKTEIGEIPEEWEVVKLGEVCKISTGKKDVNQGNPNGIYPFFDALPLIL